MSEILEHEQHEQRYVRSDAEVLRAMERTVLGSDYGANGYTTRSQADRIGDLLDLGPGRLLLDVGSGCGWPGLYLAERHGNAVVTVDPVRVGVEKARRRIADDALTEQAWATAGVAEHLPLRSGSVDAVVHTDVMC